MKYDLPSLPIHAVLPELQERLASNPSVVLAAETGSGKTTIAPLVLVKEPWLAGRKIIILEPRRLAVRMAAKRMSEIVGDTVGVKVGVRVSVGEAVQVGIGVIDGVQVAVGVLVAVPVGGMYWVGTMTT